MGKIGFKKVGCILPSQYTQRPGVDEFAYPSCISQFQSVQTLVAWLIEA